LTGQTGGEVSCHPPLVWEGTFQYEQISPPGQFDYLLAIIGVPRIDQAPSPLLLETIAEGRGAVGKGSSQTGPLTDAERLLGHLFGDYTVEGTNHPLTVYLHEFVIEVLESARTKDQEVLPPKSAQGVLNGKK